MNQIATTAYGVTWMPLLAVQRRSHRIGYDMPVREYASSDAAIAARTSARLRMASARLAIEPPKPLVKVIVKRPRGRPAKAPLNMLTVPGWQFLLTLACLRHGVSEKRVMGPLRTRTIVAARHDAMGLVYQHTQSSMPNVGRRFNRDHTSVLHALVKMGRTEKLVDKPPYDASPIRVPPKVIVPVRDASTGRFVPPNFPLSTVTTPSGNAALTLPLVGRDGNS